MPQFIQAQDLADLWGLKKPMKTIFSGGITVQNNAESWCNDLDDN
jgi:hypothetical protein